MPWTKNDPPTSYKNLSPEIRNKAIDIANSLVEDGMEEGRAIPIALSQARKSLEGEAASGGVDVWVTPHDDGWAVQSEGAEQPSKVFETKDAAVERGVELARERGSVITVQGQDGKVQDRQSFRSRIG